MRLIDADALYQSFGASGNCSNCPHDWYECQYYNEHTLMEFCEKIDAAPTVEAEPVRHGYWGDEWFNHKLKIVCSVCGCFADKWTDYCPNCGAKMNGERKEEC